MRLSISRRTVLPVGIASCLALVAAGCVPPDPGNVGPAAAPGSTAGVPAVTAPLHLPPSEEPEMNEPGSESLQFPVQKTEDEWKSQLTPEQYRITRLKGTERAFTGQYWNTKTPGTYECVCCGQALFVSDTKFQSGCGWPSFFQEIEGSIVTQPDNSLSQPRIEIMCSNCGGHLGHVFKDGPPPTGLRFCVNSGSVRLVELQAAKEEQNQE